MALQMCLRRPVDVEPRRVTWGAQCGALPVSGPQIDKQLGFFGRSFKAVIKVPRRP